MNVCILSKFPPLEGGISARTYWLARASAEAGLSIHVVSNATGAEQDYRIEGCYPHIRELPLVTLHEVGAEFPWHIPDEPHSLAKLVDKALEVIEEHRIDVIDSGYLVPYGIAAMLASRLTGVPYVVRHGGSDLAKFLRAGQLPRLLGRVLEGASAIITDDGNEASFLGLETQRVLLPPYVPDPRFFRPPDERRGPFPKLLYMGKINWHFERKGLDRLARTVAAFTPPWAMKWVAQGKGRSRFLDFCAKEGAVPRTDDFVPPWQVPDLLRSADYVFCLMHNEPIPSFSNVLIEAACCGATVVVNEGFDSDPYRPLLDGVDHRLLRVAEDDRNLPGVIACHWNDHALRNHDGLLDRGACAAWYDRNVQVLEDVAR